jgi:hypothetical protein
VAEADPSNGGGLKFMRELTALLNGPDATKQPSGSFSGAPAE